MQKIGMAAFSNCESLSSIMLPYGICEIKRMTFYKCKNLFQVTIPKTIRRIGFDAFAYSGLYNTYKSSNDKVLYIGDWLIHYKSDELSTLKKRESLESRI